MHKQHDTEEKQELSGEGQVLGISNGDAPTYNLQWDSDLQMYVPVFGKKPQPDVPTYDEDTPVDLTPMEQ